MDEESGRDMDAAIDQSRSSVAMAVTTAAMLAAETAAVVARHVRESAEHDAEPARRMRSVRRAHPASIRAAVAQYANARRQGSVLPAQARPERETARNSEQELGR